MSAQSAQDETTLLSGKDQINNRGVDLRKRKRDDTDVGSPRKRTRGRDDVANSTDSSNNNGERVSERSGSSISTNSTGCSQVSSESFRVPTSKRKASEDGDVDAPVKKRRYSHSTSETNTSESSAEASSITLKGDDVGSDSGKDFGTISAEEERFFELSSSGNTSRADFEEKYLELGPLGAGGFGSVFSGLRLSDNFSVAIKHIPMKDVQFERVVCNGKVFDVILEVALMLKSAGLPGEVGQSAAVSLLDWYTLKDELLLIMENPFLCKDLGKYVQAHRGALDEREAKMIFKQLVDAAIDLHSKGVFHRDIKLQNVLVQFDSGEPRVRIIDFGCGSFSEEKSYFSFSGTNIYAPPEWFDFKAYWARPTTVWQLGALLFSLLSSHERFTTTSYVNNLIGINSNLSKDIKMLLYMCLNRDPMERASLEELQQHLALR